MEKWKRIFTKILYPPIWLMILLTAVSAVALSAVFIKGWNESPVAYVVYVLSFYTLVVLTLFFAMVLPKRYKEMKQKVYDHPLGNRYMTDAAFKVRISLFVSLGINLVYSVFHLGSGFYYRSLWIGAIAVYYILLSMIRFVLLYHMERKKDAGVIEEYHSYRITAALMMCSNLTLSGIVLNMILGKKAPAVSDVFVITSATYTFYILTVSIMDLIKYRKYESPVLSAAKAIRFAQALVSLLSLEASIYMIAHATKEIKKLQRSEN